MLARLKAAIDPELTSLVAALLASSQFRLGAEHPGGQLPEPTANSSEAIARIQRMRRVLFPEKIRAPTAPRYKL